MRKYLNRIYKLSPLLLGVILVSSGCTITPEEAETADVVTDSMVKETMTSEGEGSTTVYEVDNADVDVQSLPTSPQNNQATLKASAPEQYTVQKGDTLYSISRKFINNYISNK